MKKVDFRTMSNKRCSHEGCNKLLKQNLIIKKPNAKLCYEHYIEQYRLKQNKR